MAYDSTLWKSGDVITAEKLNKIENQVAPLIGVMFHDIESDLMTLSLSYKDIHDAVLSGRNIVIYNGTQDNDYDEEIYPSFLVSCFSADNSGYQVYVYGGDTNIEMVANSETDLLQEQKSITY